MISPTAPWQIPGSIRGIQALGVSTDGSRVAFDGVYKPPGTASPSRENQARWLNGLCYADSKTNEVTRLSDSCGTTSISWSPDGDAFAYDCQDRVLINNLRQARSSAISKGSTPSWSPDGRQIAFRDHGHATAIDLFTMKTNSLFNGRAIQWGIHWSPDSRYVMAAQQVGLFEEIIHGAFDPLSDAPSKIMISRIEDGATSDKLWFPAYGEDDRGYYWITNYQAFLKQAQRPLVAKPCP